MTDRVLTNPAQAGNRRNDRRNVILCSIADCKAQSSGAVTDISGSTKIPRINGFIPDLVDRSFPILRAVYNVIPTSNAVLDDPNYGHAFIGHGSDIRSNKSVITGTGFGLLNDSGDSLLPASKTGCGDTSAARLSSPATRPPDLLTPPSRE